MTTTNSNGSSNGHGTGSLVMNDEQFGRFERLVDNERTLRREWLTRMFDPRRNIDDACGYPRGVPSPEMYQELYDREAIATRVVQLLPKETWQIQPLVYEDEDPDKATPFEEAWDGLGSMIAGEESWYQEESGSRVWDELCRLDELSGIGGYGVLLFGLDDGGKDLREPAKTKKGAELLYLRSFPQTLAQINQYESNLSDRRFGYPTEYLLSFNDPRGDTGADIGLTQSDRSVHWSRTLHVADNVSSSKVFGVPRLQPVFNRVWDLKKIYGASGEGFYRGSVIQYSLETNPQLGGNVSVDKNEVRDMMESFTNDFQRYALWRGISMKAIAPMVADPTPHVAVMIEAICIQLGVPIRVFKGSERGELASSQDDAAWNDRLRHRQVYYVTPSIIAPFVDRLISYGVLPEPKKGGTTVENRRRLDRLQEVFAERGRKVRVDNRTGRVLILNAEDKVVGTRSAPIEKGGYFIEWPDLESQTAADKADIASKRITAINGYFGGNTPNGMAPMDFWTREMGYTEEEAETIIENAAEHEKEVADKAQKAQEEAMAQQQEMMAQGVGPDPNQMQQGGAVPPAPAGPTQAPTAQKRPWLPNT